MDNPATGPDSESVASDAVPQSQKENKAARSEKQHDVPAAAPEKETPPSQARPPSNQVETDENKQNQPSRVRKWAPNKKSTPLAEPPSDSEPKQKEDVEHAPGGKRETIAEEKNVPASSPATVLHSRATPTAGESQQTTKVRSWPPKGKTSNVSAPASEKGLSESTNVTSTSKKDSGLASEPAVAKNKQEPVKSTPKVVSKEQAPVKDPAKTEGANGGVQKKAWPPRKQPESNKQAASAGRNSPDSENPSPVADVTIDSKSTAARGSNQAQQEDNEFEECSAVSSLTESTFTMPKGESARPPQSEQSQQNTRNRVWPPRQNATQQASTQQASKEVPAKKIPAPQTPPPKKNEATAPMNRGWPPQNNQANQGATPNAPGKSGEPKQMPSWAKPKPREQQNEAKSGMAANKDDASNSVEEVIPENTGHSAVLEETVHSTMLEETGHSTTLEETVHSTMDVTEHSNMLEDTAHTTYIEEIVEIIEEYEVEEGEESMAETEEFASEGDYTEVVEEIVEEVVEEVESEEEEEDEEEEDEEEEEEDEEEEEEEGEEEGDEEYEEESEYTSVSGTLSSRTGST
ncbi:hypothetical protein ACA910_000288 [Epithemia clementina (nom. ined.)]